MIGSMLTDIDTIISHSGYSLRVNAMCFYTCAVNLCGRAGKVLQVALGYLAAAAIAGA